MDNPETLATVRENRRGNQELTIQGHWQQLEKTEGTIKNGQSRETGTIGYTRHMTNTNIVYIIPLCEYAGELWDNSQNC